MVEMVSALTTTRLREQIDLLAALFLVDGWPFMVWLQYASWPLRVEVSFDILKLFFLEVPIFEGLRIVVDFPRSWCPRET